MTARIIALDSDEHREVQSLLPWLANGTLQPAELERVRLHVAECDRCQADAAWQQAVRTAAVSLPTAAADVEHGWAAIRAKLQPRAKEPSPRAAWARFGWPVLAGAQAFAMLVIAVVLFAQRTPQEAEYRALGNSAASPSANALVVFQPGASEAQMRNALRTVQARIVDGPTVTDAYLLHVPSSTPAQLAKLRGDAAVARVESLQGGTP
jgi:hypothetical protein